MSLWLAVGSKGNDALGVEEADTEAQAMYQFMQHSIYPYTVIQLPDTVVTRDEMDCRLCELSDSYC